MVRRYGAGNVVTVVGDGSDDGLTGAGIATAAQSSIAWLIELFEHAPTFTAMLHGPDHRIAFANRAFRLLIDADHGVGSSLAEAMPGAARQGMLDSLHSVYRTGAAPGAQTLRYAAELAVSEDQAAKDVRLLDFTCHPVRDASGAVDGIFVQGADVTAGAGVEEALRQSEAQMKSVLQAIPGVVFVKDRAGRMLLGNQGVTALVGKDPADYIGKTDAEFLDDPVQARQIMANDQRIMARGVAEVIDEIVSTPDGRPLVWMSTKTPFRDEAGEVIGLIGSSFDVTDQRLTTAALAQSREQLRTERDRFVDMFRQAPGLMAMLDGPDHVFSFVNPAYLTLIGDRPVIGKAARDALPEVAGQGFFKLLDQVYQTGEPYAAHTAPVHLQRTPAGPMEARCLDFVYQPVFGPAGEVTGIFFQGTDVTERAAAEAALSEREDLLRLATDAADIGLWDVDMINDVLFWPPRVKALFGISPDRPVSMADFYRGLHPDDAPATTAAFQAAADPAIRATYDVEYRTIGQEDGVVRWVAAKGRGRFDDTGRCVRVFGTAIDVTARKQTEARILEMNETLEQQVQERTSALRATEEQLRQAQKMEAVGQLTGGIAHDFNNLLTAITGSLELLDIRLKAGQFDAAPRYIEAAQGGARRATALTQRLLAFSRRQTLDPKGVDVNALVADMLDLIQRSIGPTIRLEVVAEPQLWITLIDPGQLENALLNLCINARDASPGGGVLKIITANRQIAGAEAQRLDLAGGDYVALSVADSGEGMSPEVIEHAFEPFFTTKPMGQGTGLGLSMTYGFVRQSGGQVDIESQIGRGTTISLFLPRFAGSENAQQNADPAPAHEAPADNRTVLVIDDEPIVRMLIVDALTDAGYHTLEAEDGVKGYEMLRSSQAIDLLVTDVGLPGGMNGRQVADAARLIRPGLKVLFITGYAETSVMSGTQMDPDTQIMAKPFVTGTLIGKVQALLG